MGMTTCCTTDAANRFFTRSARRYAKTFRKKGPDKASAILIDEVCRLGVHSRSILDVGCGIGGAHLTLLSRGASVAQGVDVSEGMVKEARALAQEMGLDGRVRYLCGDVTMLDGMIEEADITVMDKVLCCYPDPVVLIEKTATKTRSILALSYPRDAMMVRAGFGFVRGLGLLLGWKFRPFYHDPGGIDEAAAGTGFREEFARTTLVWQVKVFVRQQ